MITKSISWNVSNLQQSLRQRSGGLTFRQIQAVSQQIEHDPWNNKFFYLLAIRNIFQQIKMLKTYFHSIRKKLIGWYFCPNRIVLREIARQSFARRQRQSSLSDRMELESSVVLVGVPDENIKFRWGSCELLN